MRRIERALISVYDKTGVVEFARGLASLNVEIVSTGGTHKLLSSNGIPVKEVSSLTGFPEILDGRVKTINPGLPQASWPCAKTPNIRSRSPTITSR